MQRATNFTIRLGAPDFDEGDARINYHLIEIESENLIEIERSYCFSRIRDQT